MTCDSSRHIDVVAYLVEPTAPEWAEFRAHYPGCGKCSTELSHWTALEGALRSVTVPTHPADELLLAYRRAPESLSQAQRDEMSAHLESCGPCRDAVGAVVALDLKQLLAAAEPAAQPKPQKAGLWQGLMDSLGGLFELPAPVLALGAVALLVLALGIPFLLQQSDDQSLRPAPPIAQQPEPPPPAPPEQAPVLEPEPVEMIAVEELPGPPAEDPQPPAPAEVVAEAPAPEREPVAEPPAPPVELVQKPPSPSPVPEPAPLPVEKKPAPAPAPRADSWVVASLGPEPLVFAAPGGLPGGRIGGSARSGPAGPAPLALVPKQIGQTLESHPTLYWFLSARSDQPVQVRVNDIDSMKQLLSTTLRAPLAQGFHALRLADHGVRLAAGRNYEWVVSVPDSDVESSGGILRRVSNPALTNSLKQADPASRVRLLAQQGIWYDAFDLLSRSIARRPSDAELRRGRAELLEQVGLSEAAAWDRSR